MTPDIYAQISLKKTEDDGRKSPIQARDYGCPLFFQDEPELERHGYDCRLLLSQIGKEIAPGETVTRVPIKFLVPESILPYLRVGARFYIWEGKVIWHGEVLSIEAQLPTETFE